MATNAKQTERKAIHVITLKFLCDEAPSHIPYHLAVIGTNFDCFHIRGLENEGQLEILQKAGCHDLTISGLIKKCKEEFPNTPEDEIIIILSQQNANFFFSLMSKNTTKEV